MGLYPRMRVRDPTFEKIWMRWCLVAPPISYSAAAAAAAAAATSATRTSGAARHGSWGTALRARLGNVNKLAT